MGIIGTNPWPAICDQRGDLWLHMSRLCGQVRETHDAPARCACAATDARSMTERAEAAKQADESGSYLA